MIAETQPWSFPVSLQRIRTEHGVEIPWSRAVVRSDSGSPLSVVGKDYALHTHGDVMAAVTEWGKRLGKSKVGYSLEREGAQLLATHTFPDVRVLTPRGHGEDGRKVGDMVAMRVHILNSYNAQTSLVFSLGGLVLRCLNGMTIAQDIFHMAFRHLGDGWDGKLPDPEIVLKAFTHAGETWRTWSELTISKVRREYIIQQASLLRLLPAKILLAEAPRFTSVETVWDLHQAFTYCVTHKSPRLRASSQVERTRKISSLFERAVSARESELIEHLD